MAAISSRQEYNISPSCARPDWRQLAQLLDRTEQAGNQFAALFAGALLVEQQAEPLFETIDDLDGRMSRQIFGVANLLIGLEVQRMTASEGEQISTLAPHPSALLRSPNRRLGPRRLTQTVLELSKIAKQAGASAKDQ